MATQSKHTKTITSLIDWPIVGVAGVIAGLFVIGSVLAVWTASRPMSSIKANMAALSPSQQGAGVSPDANIPDDLDLSSDDTASPAAAKGRGEDNPLATPDYPSPAVTYPESDGRVIALAPAPGMADERKSRPEPACETETSVESVEFAKDPMEAARLAREEHKLTFVLHVSGNFEESKFT
ncbi:MAG TPA: hypothetical protein VGX70_22165 [Gemmataceae bacterium]|jgi:hypothetical protein|nr:hypothetical protein [Gemmataceae bacterium]